MDCNLLDVVNENFSTYAAMTIQDRAIVDARDGLKPSARQCIYSQLLSKITYKKPFAKSQVSVGNALGMFYIHGDSSCYELMAYLAKPYTMRYALEDFKGQCGIISDGKPAAARYTLMRLGELGTKLFEGIEEEAIDLWFDNYSNTLKYPSVTPSLGYYNICNGTTGIATSLSSSIPQFCLNEVNEAMIKLLWNPEISYDEIYCPPDFCTGGTILNADEVKEILKVGHGGSVRLRATATYVEEENAIYFTEIPYGVYVNTITSQIVEALNDGNLTGIMKDGIKDLSTMTANLKIVLERGVNPERMIKKLFKLTSLSNCYTINMMMLDNGKVPKMFGWREALQAHLDHEKTVRRRIHESKIKKIEFRINIIDGLIIAVQNINEVVNTIKKSENKEIAIQNLITNFLLNQKQAEAIMKMTLSKLTHLGITALENEKATLLEEHSMHSAVLNNDELLYKEIECGLREVMKVFGDSRRTKLMNLDFKASVAEDDELEPIEVKQLLIHFTNLGNLYTQESTTLMTAKRGGRGSKIKMSKNETILKTLSDSNLGSLVAFTNKGKMHLVYTSDLAINSKINSKQLFDLDAGERITTITTSARRQDTGFFTFITKNGMIKKTKASEYNCKKGKSIIAIKLRGDDEVLDVLYTKDEMVSLLTSDGNFVIIDTESINPIGRNSMGVRAIKLNEDSFVIDSGIVNKDDKFVLAVTRDGSIKKTPVEEAGFYNRGAKGKKIQSVNTVKTLTIQSDCDIIITSNERMIRLNTSSLPTLSRTAVGVKSMNLLENEIITNMLKLDF